MNPKNEEMKIRVYNYIKNTIEEQGYSPSFDEIAEALSCAKSTAHKFALRLVDEGHLERRGKGLYIAGDPMVYRMPVIGAVACGRPTLALEDITEYIPIDKSQLHSGEYFGLIAEGESMIKVGVTPGDIVFVEKSDTAFDGDIVVAMIVDEQTGEERATLKRFYRDAENNRFILHPENDTMPDIVTSHLRILGIARKVLKSLK